MFSYRSLTTLPTYMVCQKFTLWYVWAEWESVRKLIFSRELKSNGIFAVVAFPSDYNKIINSASPQQPPRLQTGP